MSYGLSLLGSPFLTDPDVHVYALSFLGWRLRLGSDQHGFVALDSLSTRTRLQHGEKCPNEWMERVGSRWFRMLAGYQGRARESSSGEAVL